MLNLPDIEFSKKKSYPEIDSDNSLFSLPFYKDAEYFSNLDNYVYFIKAVEKMVRRSNYYSRYIKYLREEIGLTFCQVLSNIDTKDSGENDKNKVTIEMHHGPILTLFDYVAIVVDYLLEVGQPITTFRVAKIVLEEHYNNNVQVVMLSKTVHQVVHAENIFINYKQGFGNLNAFLTKYYKGLQNEQIMKINKYIETSKKYDSFDRDLLSLKSNLLNWSNY